MKKNSGDRNKFLCSAYSGVCKFFGVISPKKFISVIVALALVVTIGGGVLKVYSKYNFAEETTVPEENKSGFVDIFDNTDGEDVQVNALKELRDTNNLSTLLKEWATSSSDSELMKSKKVINFLLIGGDTREANGAYGNSDVIMLVSLNVSTKKIILTSLYRDSYTYISTSYGDKYAKINAAYANDGANGLIETVENDYKIAIDHYVSIDFHSFIEIVDAMGGVTLDVKQYEAKAITNEFYFDCPYGEGVTLNGEQALGFCRIRHCDADADVSRTRRQRQFITSVIDRAKSIDSKQISSIIDTLLKYVKTDCSTSNLISYATSGVLNKWYNFEIVTQSMPSEDFRMPYSGNSWVWIVDYPAAAQALQQSIYGTTNIELAENRITAIDIMKGKNSSASSSDSVKSTAAPQTEAEVTDAPPDPVSETPQNPPAVQNEVNFEAPQPENISETPAE